MTNMPTVSNDSATSDLGLLATMPSVSGTQAVASGVDTPYEQRVLRSLRRIVRSIELHSKQLSANNHITGPQLVCLLAAVNQGPLSVTKISHEVHLSASTVVGILDRLEEKGWITRTRTSDDRRYVMVAATDSGATLARQTPSPLQHRLADALNTLSELERATIAFSLERVVALMEEQVIDPSTLLDAGLSSPPAI